MDALFLGRADCYHSARAETFLRGRFDRVVSVLSSGTGIELDPALLHRPPDALFAFRSRIIVRPAVIEAIPLCINFHPGPPERRGSGCVNFAIAAGDDSYGSTCHYIDSEIDHGPIIDVRRFPITESDGVAEVLARTYDYMLCQFYDVAGAVAAGKALTHSGERWNGPVGKAREMNALREIGLAPDARADLERQVRATAFGPYQPYIMLHGERFVRDTADRGGLELADPPSSCRCRTLGTPRGSVKSAAKPRLLISQADNFNAQFGTVLRSSALFWARNDDRVKTTISFSNYWDFKNGINVAVIVNVRDMNGTLVARHPVSFEAAEVCNFAPPEGFEGSVEVEVFAIANLRIPYAAIMAIYETAEGISMVHAYARAYSQHEVEEGRTICVGEESCWTVREDEELASFAIFHNGSVMHPRQTVILRVRNYRGEERSATIEFETLLPFQTVVIEPAAHLADLAQFLGGKPGNARLSFTLGRAFTRMLCGVRRKDWRQLQVTHSNFDYSEHDTDTITEGHRVAYLHAPQLPSGRNLELVVYPDTSPGEYLARYGNKETAFATGDIVRLPQTKRRPIAFRRKDGILPSRIVVGWTLNGPQRVVPAECSVGVVHHRQPPKHSAWMVVSQVFGSLVTWIDYAEVYGGCPDDATWDCVLYAANRKEPYRATLVYGTIAREPFLTLERIFGPAIDLGGTFGCLSLRSSYGGLWIFSTLQKNDALTLEHSF